ncbi:MAG: DUF1822 family protein [Calothrix sp. FI2-JRJ7]|jgi:hypothetical protein|nr:DUF1822 family protein [Calothrix sp. FI2-JRJ7]
MLTNHQERLTFTVPLTLENHSLAQAFRRQQSDSTKAKQVYLNTLAVCAVRYYLCCMGIETNCENCSSWNSVAQSFMDVGDLEIPQLGKLECRPILPNSDIVRIPAETWYDRIGYVGVQFDEALREGTLLGFVKNVASCELPIRQLLSLEDLLIHLDELQQTALSRMQVNLSQWFENVFAPGWQSLEALLTANVSQLAFSVRNETSITNTVRGAKLIDLGLQLGQFSLALLIAITQEAKESRCITIQLHPMTSNKFLPTSLKLILMSTLGEIIQEVHSRSMDNYIQLKRFRGKPGEEFTICITNNEFTLTENFVI